MASHLITIGNMPSTDSGMGQLINRVYSSSLTIKQSRSHRILKPINTGDHWPLWLTAQKIKPPRFITDIIQCPLAMLTLQRYPVTALSTLIAPAGYGKSSLLALWYPQLQQENVQVGYLSLDAQDNDERLLASYLLYALCECGVNLEPCEISDFSLLQYLPLPNLLGHIQRAINQHQKPIVMMLDHFESLNSTTVSNVIQPLLDHHAPHMHWSISSRIVLPLNIAALTFQDQVLKITTEQLKFKPHQIKSLFNENLPLKILNYLSNLSDGWPVALLFLKNCLDTETDISTMESDLSNNYPLFCDYITQQISVDLNQDIRTQLMELSILNIKQQPNSPLLALANTHYPLIEPENYRLNPLFRRCLQQQLEQQNPQRAQTLHLAAANNYANQNQLKQAVEHCIKANQPQHALTLIEQAGGVFIIWLTQGFSHLESVLNLLDQALQVEDPALAKQSMVITLFHCIVSTKSGNKQMAAQDYSAIIEQYEKIKSQLPKNEQQKTAYGLAIIKNVLEFNQGKMMSDLQCNVLKQQIKQIPPDDHHLLARHHNILCVAYTQRGELAMARYYSEMAINFYQQFKSSYGENYIYLHLGDVSFAEGEVTQADAYYQRALNVARRHFSDDKGMISSIQILIAELHYQKNNGSGPNIQLLLKRMKGQEAWFDIYFAGYVTASNLTFNQHGIEAALAVIDNARDFFSKQQLTLLIQPMIIQRATLLMRAKQFAAARDVLQQANITLAHYKKKQSTNIAWRELQAVVRVIISLQIEDDGITAALENLNYFNQPENLKNNMVSRLDYQVLFCLAYLKRSQQTPALDHLKQAILLSLQCGYVRIFLDHGKQLTPLLQQYLLTDVAEPVLIQAKKIIEKINIDITKQQPCEIMTKREQQILQQLAQGFSNKIIAHHINISLNTVRFHLKNIFTKLQVNNRIQAVEVAKSRAIIKFNKI